MLFDENFIAWAEDNPIDGLIKACETVFEHVDELRNSNRDLFLEEAHDLLWDAASFVQVFLEANQIHIDATAPTLSSDLGENCTQLDVYLRRVLEEARRHAMALKVASIRHRYSVSLKATFGYEFSTGDLHRIQRLINEIRERIGDNQDLEEDHKQRLLKRLETLQSELHKRVSDLDRFWGLVGDAGVVLGKLGNDAKPIVDRVKEIAEIVWRTQARTEELSTDSPNPMLEHDTAA